MTAKRNLRYWILLLDLVCAAVSLACASYIHQLNSVSELLTLPVLQMWWPVLVVALSGWTVLSSAMHLDGFRGGWSFPTMASRVSLGVTALSVTLFSFAFLSHYPYSRLVIVYFACLSFVGFIAIRCGVSLFLRAYSRRGARQRVVVIGNGNIAKELARKLDRHPELMCEIVGFLYPGNGDQPTPPGPTPALAPTSVPTVGIVDLLRAHRVDVVLVALPDGSAAELRKLVSLCREEGIGISLVPQWYELYVSKANLVDVDGLPLLSLVDNRLSALEFTVKRVMDVVLGSFFLVLSTPLLLVSGAALRLTRGRAFRTESRCGRNSRAFAMYRLNVDRTLPETLAPWERTLAQLSLTELPQLWNVVSGDMALVGPRPESPERVRHYSDWQRLRLSITPGLTGLAQVQGLREEHSSDEKARFDLEYIYRWSPVLDLSLILQTCWTLAVRFISPAHPGGHQSPAEEAVGTSSSRVPVSEVRYADSTNSCSD